MAPFPVYDTEYVSNVKNHIKKMKEDDKTNYDELPVAACEYCDSLRIKVDDLDNDYCMRCGSVNSIKIYKDIFEYQKFIDEKYKE
jgi:hypothetical protein